MMRAGRLAVLLLIIATPAAAQDSIRVERIEFGTGPTAREISDSIGGFERVDYLVSARAGQTLTVMMSADNLSSYFDLTAPGATKPFFLGSESGNAHSVRIPSDGDYTVSVYLLRLAARDNQSAHFTLNVSLQGAQ
jgi:hypothetical protein